MYVHVHVLEGRGSLADLGAHPRDHIVVRVGEPHCPAGTAGMASETIAAPVMDVPIGITIPDKLSAKIKHHITRRVYNRDMNKFQLRLYTLKHTDKGEEQPKWLGIVGFRLLRLTDGYVVERWVAMQPATKTEPGALRVRVVVRENEADARALLASGPTGWATHSTPCEGCCCDVCDPHFQWAKPKIEIFVFDEKHIMTDKVGRALVGNGTCVIS